MCLVDTTSDVPKTKEKRPPVQVSLAAHEALKDLAERKPTSPSYFIMVSRLVEWFCKQDDAVRTTIIGGVDQGMEIHYADALRRMAQELRDKTKRPRATNTAEGVQPESNSLGQGAGEKRPETPQPRRSR